MRAFKVPICAKTVQNCIHNTYSEYKCIFNPIYIFLIKYINMNVSKFVSVKLRLPSLYTCCRVVQHLTPVIGQCLAAVYNGRFYFFFFNCRRFYIVIVLKTIWPSCISSRQYARFFFFKWMTSTRFRHLNNT